MANSKRILIVIFVITLFAYLKFLFPKAVFFFAKWFIFTHWLISPFIFLLVGVLAALLFPNLKRNKEGKNKRKTMLILTFIYLIILLLFGLIVEFTRNAFWGNFTYALTDLFKVASIILIQEFVRSKLVTNVAGKYKKFYYVLIVIAFFLWDFDFANLSMRLQTAEFFFNDVIIALLIQGFLTYVAKDSGLASTLIHLLLIEFVFHITPVFPDFDWFFQGMYNLIMYIIFIFIISYEAMTFDRDVRRSIVKKSNPFVYVVLLSLLIVLVSFQLGFFTYKPTAIITNSMIPNFKRGDAVIVKKINEKSIRELKINDIIEYKMGNRYVVHRIIDIDKTDEEAWLFTTKGDYNNGPDAEAVTFDQIKGIVQFTIPFIGYPSVYFIDIFDKGKAPVETGGN